MKLADMTFSHAGCCAGYNVAEVTHPNTLRSVVEDKGAGVYTVLTFAGWMPHVPLIEGLAAAGVDAELARVAGLPAPVI